MTLSDPTALPPTVPERLQATLREYWLERAAQHVHDSYAGVPLFKFPEDLRVYEHLLWKGRVNVVIELGAAHGGSALWFRDRLRTFESYGRIARPHVISVDSDAARSHDALTGAEGITFVAGDLTDAGLPDAVAAHVPAGATCMVIEDSAHTYETTRAALDGFARFVPVEGFFIVEDGCVDIEEMRVSASWPRGVLPALKDWLATPAGQAFTVRRELEVYGLSCHPYGFLQRTSSPPAEEAPRRPRRRLASLWPGGDTTD